MLQYRLRIVYVIIYWLKSVQSDLFTEIDGKSTWTVQGILIRF